MEESISEDEPITSLMLKSSISLSASLFAQLKMLSALSLVGHALKISLDDAVSAKNWPRSESSLAAKSLCFHNKAALAALVAIGLRTLTRFAANHRASAVVMATDTTCAAAAWLRDLQLIRLVCAPNKEAYNHIARSEEERERTPVEVWPVAWAGSIPVQTNLVGRALCLAAVGHAGINSVGLHGHRRKAAIGQRGVPAVKQPRRLHMRRGQILAFD